MLEIKTLKFNYPDQQDEYTFSLNVATGSSCVVQGKSGVGKSTLLNLIAGFLSPTSGRILFNKADITHLPAHKRPLSVVFQSDNLFEHLDCWTNIALGLSPSGKLDIKATSIINDAMKRLGMSGYETRLPEALSGGQQQRIALARALARALYLSHSLLLFDEPFSALDRQTRLDCLEAVDDLVKNYSMTALLVSHDNSDAQYLKAKVYSL